MVKDITDENIDEKKLSSKETETPQATKGTKKVAKAGKRSAKAIAEAKELDDKEERKAKVAAGIIEEEPVQKKGPTPNARPKAERRSKKYQEATKNIDPQTVYDLENAMELAKKSSFVKFDAAVELHIRLNVDPRQADQNIRGNLVLPHGTGKVVRVAVFGNPEDVKKAKSAGADISGEAELIDKLKKEEIEFDVLIATPQMMSQLGKFARLLGPRGLMPNPKSGTVTSDVSTAVKQAKAGMVEYRVDSNGIVHQNVGKVSFDVNHLVENTSALIDAIKQAKPTNLKGNYIESVFVTTTMGPSIKLAV